MRSLKRELRTADVCDFIFSNPESFKLEDEIKEVPQEVMTEDFLIKVFFNYVNVYGTYMPGKDNRPTIPDECMTLPVLVAFVLGNRRYTRMSSVVWYGNAPRVFTPVKLIEEKSNIDLMADCVEQQIDALKLDER